jgi:hypothetical protein
VSTSSPDVDNPRTDVLHLDTDETPAAAAHEVPDAVEPRVEVLAHSRGPVVLREWPLLLVIVVIGTGLGVIAMHHFRWGSLAIAGGTIAAACLRSVLPARRIGLLAVRGRVVDVLTMGSIGIALTVLALVTKT